MALQECEDFCLVYIDDVLIFSENFDLHHQHLDSVLQRLEDAGFHIRINKCKFA